RYLCMVHGRSGSQVEHNEPFVFQNTPEAFTQILVQTVVEIQPPERRPRKDHKLRPDLLQPFEFPDSGGIIGWCSPVLPVSFQKRDDSMTTEKTTSAPLLRID